MGVPWHNQNFYYAILAYDASGNRGLISNTVFVMVTKEEANEITTDQKQMTKETSAGAGALPQSTKNETEAYIWVPIMIVLLMITLLIGSGLTIVYRRNWPSKEYHCSEEDDKIPESEWSTSHHDESRSTTTSAGVSTNLTIEDDLSVVDDHQKVEDVWTTASSSSGGGDGSGPPSYISNCLEPRIHVMEDFTVYRDLSTISDVPSEYCHLDLMLSALLASKQRLQQQQLRQKQQQQKHLHNESLV